MRWPPGFQSSGISCGIKSGGAADLGALVAEQSVEWAGTFTTNAAAAAPVSWCRARLDDPVRAVVVNSGNANACTGAAGKDHVQATAAGVARELGCAVEEVLVASTGPIGMQLPIDKILDGLPSLIRSTGPEVDNFARAIMTTDTTTKIAWASAGGASIVGVAKGAAMLAPNMATMLCFVATDAQLEGGGALQVALDSAVARSFNRVCIDACESTNDSVFLFSSGRTAVAPKEFTTALEAVCSQLAEQMVRDAEGASRFVRVMVLGARSEETAVALGRSVASSALWRSAVHGGDPNWGRIASALGACERGLDMTAVDISIGNVPVFQDGEPSGRLADAAAEMRVGDVEVRCRVGDGSGEAAVLTTDLSPDYVKLNAEGTS